MKICNRKLLYTLVGISAGCISWPIAEVLLFFQGEFSSYLIFSMALGSVFGLIVGAVFGSAEGIIISNIWRLLAGSFKGLFVGAIGGLIGFICGQAVLFWAGEVFMQQEDFFKLLGLPLSRAIGWMLMGSFVGTIDAVRNFTFRRFKIGLAGGILGGLTGGLVFEYLQLVVPIVVLGRIAGLVCFGMLLGFFYGLVESRLALGQFIVLNGPNKGNVYPLVMSKMKIGSSKRSDIILGGYKGVKEFHAYITPENDTQIIFAEAPGKTLYVNNDQVNKHSLKFDDVIKIGSAKLLYSYS